jgi:hypothetical protein
MATFELSAVTYKGINSSLALPCDRPWPQLELFLPVCLTHGRDLLRRYEFLTMFYRTFILFWPKVSNTSLLIMVDEENTQDYEFQELETYTKKHGPSFPGRSDLLFVSTESVFVYIHVFEYFRCLEN